MTLFKMLFSWVANWVRLLNSLDARLDALQLNCGRLFVAQNKGLEEPNLQAYEFKVFSQWGEDGIIQRLVQIVPIQNQTFIEFGVEDFYESNCRFLLLNNNWRGFVIDGSRKKIRRLQNSHYFWKYQLEAEAEFLNAQNINTVLARSGFNEDLGILSVDVDGIDYYLLKEIRAYRPRILVCEYNAVFGPSRKISVPYDPNFKRAEKHFSHLYFGASLAALNFLAEQKGMSLVGTNQAGVNAFFVRNDLLGKSLRKLTPEEAFTDSMARESRDSDGNLSFIGGRDRQDLIRGLPVLNVESGILEDL